MAYITITHVSTNETDKRGNILGFFYDFTSFSSHRFGFKCTYVNMNVLGVFLLCYLVTCRFLKCINLDGNLSEWNGNNLHENNNQSTITTIKYGALIALKNKQSRISPSTCLLLRKYKILQKQKIRQRWKRG